MTTPPDPNDLRHRIGLFRHSVIGSLLHPPEGRTLSEMMQEKACITYEIPGSHRTHVAKETMRCWLRAYREGGFEALLPKVRNDAGTARAIPARVADMLCEMKEENRAMTVPLLIAAVRDRGGLPEGIVLAESTVHRLLKSKGLMQKLPAEPTSKDKRKFEFELAGELWTSDVMHGPAVEVEGRRKYKSYLIAIIDDATRLITHAAFALSEKVQAYLPILEQAITRRGLPLRLYVDNGAVFRSNHLKLACAKLGITLIHSRPYVPQGRGKIERFFRTVRMQLLPTLQPQDLRSLDALNRKLATWIQGDYHQRPHKGLDGLTPLDAWARASQGLRLPDSSMDLADLFLFEEKRKVATDRTVSLHGVLYEVDAILVGQTVTLRFNPALLGRPIKVVVAGKPAGLAVRVNAYANCHVKRDYNTRAAVASVPPQVPAATIRMSDIDDKDIF